MAKNQKNAKSGSKRVPTEAAAEFEQKLAKLKKQFQKEFQDAVTELDAAAVEEVKRKIKKV